MTNQLSGKVAIVTGGAAGLGLGIVELFLAEGAQVVVADIDETALLETRVKFSEAYGADQVRAVTMNVTDEAAVASAFTEASAEYGGVDILVSNAGISSSAPIDLGRASK